MSKGLCTAAGDKEAKFIFDSDAPKPGFYYSVEEYHNGTAAQNKFFHLLVSEYWNSGMHSFDTDDFGHFRDLIKKVLGEGFELFLYTTIELTESGKSKAVINKVKTYEEVPQSVKDDPDMHQMIFAKLKSWADYTLAQRKRTIDRLITEMINSGVNSKRFESILSDMQTTEEIVKEVFE